MIAPPNWAKDAVPTTRGWVDPSTGELLKAQRLTFEQIEDFLGQGVGQVEEKVQYNAPIEEEVQYNAPTMLHEAPVGNKSLQDMTKAELVALAEQSGVQVSRWASKEVLIEKLS